MAKIKGKDLKLECTCSACPEQYDVYKGDEKIGYLRLRHGGFRADYYNGAGDTEIVYSTTTEGDGSFTSEERGGYLKKAKKKIAKAYNKDYGIL